MVIAIPGGETAANRSGCTLAPDSRPLCACRLISSEEAVLLRRVQSPTLQRVWLRSTDSSGGLL